MFICLLQEREHKLDSQFYTVAYTRSRKIAEDWVKQASNDVIRCFSLVKPLNPQKMITFSFENSGDWYKMFDKESGEVVSSDHDIRVDDVLGFFGFEEKFISLNSEDQEDVVADARTLDQALKAVYNEEEVMG